MIPKASGQDQNTQPLFKTLFFPPILYVFLHPDLFWILLVQVNDGFYSTLSMINITFSVFITVYVQLRTAGFFFLDLNLQKLNVHLFQVTSRLQCNLYAHIHYEKQSAETLPRLTARTCCEVSIFGFKSCSSMFQCACSTLIGSGPLIKYEVEGYWNSYYWVKISICGVSERKGLGTRVTAGEAEKHTHLKARTWKLLKAVNADSISSG